MAVTRWWHRRQPDELTVNPAISRQVPPMRIDASTMWELLDKLAELLPGEPAQLRDAEDRIVERGGGNCAYADIPMHATSLAYLRL